MDAATAQAICGEVAAVAFARAYGRNPTVAEALDIARRNGRWDANAGMHGPPSEKALLDDMGIPNRLEPNPSQDAVLRDLDNGNPVILSSPGHDHYFVVTGYQRQPDGSVLFDTGNTGMVFKNNPHRYWSWGEIGPQAALFMQEPTAQGPSTATDMSPQQGARNDLPQTMPSDATFGGDTGARRPIQNASLTPDPNARQNLSDPNPYGQMARDAATKYGVPPDLLRAQLSWESGGFDPDVISGKRTSSAGAVGLGQFMPATAAAYGVDPTDPRSSADGAARYMADLYKQYGDWDLALIAYNGGDGAVRAYQGGQPYAETQSYLKNIHALRTGDTAASAGGYVPPSSTTAGYQPQFDTTRSTGGNQPPPPEEPADPWAPVNATLARVRTGISDLGNSIMNGSATPEQQAAYRAGLADATRPTDPLAQPQSWMAGAPPMTPSGPAARSAEGQPGPDPAGWALGQVQEGLDRPNRAVRSMVNERITNDSGVADTLQAGYEGLTGTRPDVSYQQMIERANPALGQKIPDETVWSILGGTPEGMVLAGAIQAAGGVSYSQAAGAAATVTADPLNALEVLGLAGRGVRLAGGAGVDAIRALGRAADEVGTIGEGMRVPTAGPVGRVVGRGLEVIGQGGVAGGAIEDAPRAAEEAGQIALPGLEPPTAAPSPPRPGFAGRWNISKFPPELQDSMRAAHESDPAAFEAASRGTISDPELERMASEVDIAPLLDKWKPGTIWTAEEQRAARIAVAKTFKDVRDAALTDNGDAGNAALALAVQRAQAVAGVGSEAGRLLRQQRSTVAADELLNWREIARGGVEDAFARVNGVHDEIAAVIRDLPDAARTRATAALDEARAAADEGYRAARNGVADHPTEAPATNGTAAPETPQAGQQTAPPPEAAPEPTSASEVAPTPERAPVDANGKPLTRKQQTALEREKIRREFALARYGKRQEELTAQQRNVVEGLARREEARQQTIRQAEQLASDRKAALEQQKQAAKDTRKATSERLKLEQQRAAAKDSTRAAAERQAIRDQQGHELRLRVAEQNHHQAMVKLFDAISDPARRNTVRQLVNTLGGRNKNLTPWQQAAKSIRVAQRGRTIKPDEQQQLYKNLIKAVTGADDPVEQAQRMQALRKIVQEANTEEMGRLLQRANAPGFGDNLQAFYVANILSGPATHVRNIFGNTVSMALSPVEHALTVPIEAGLSTLQGRPRERFMGEIPHEIGGWLFAIPEAAQRFKAIMRHGFDPSNMERLAGVRGESNIPILKYPMNAIFRGLGGMDAFFGHMVYMGELNRLAYRQARMERLTGQAFVDRFADLVSVPTPASVEAAQKAARYRTFKQELDTFGNWLRQSHNVKVAGPVMRKVMPFISTPYNIVRFDLERSPLAAAKIAWDLLPEVKGVKGASEYAPQLALGPGGTQAVEAPIKSAADISDRLGRLALGTAAFYAAVKGYESDSITGNGPPGQGDRDLWLHTHQPNSFWNPATGQWTSWQNIPAISTVMGMTTGALDAQRYGHGDAGQIAAAAGAGMMRSIVQRSFFSGLANLFDAIAPGGSPGAVGGRLLASTAGGFIPASGLLRGVARGLDTQVKQPMNTVETFTQNLPGLSRGVQPRLDRSGQPITRDTRFLGLDFPGSALAGSLLNPAQVDTPTTDPTSLEAERSGQPFPGVSGTIAGQQLDPQGKYDYQKLVGQLATARRAALYATDAYKQAPPLQQEQMTAQSDALAQSRARALFAGQAGIDLSPDKPDKYDPRLYDLLARSLPLDQVAAYRANPVLLELDVADAVRAMTDYRQSRGTTPRPTREQMQLASLSSSKYWSREYALWSRDPARRSAAAQQDATVRGLATATP